MLSTIIVVLIFLLAPILIIYLCQKYKWMNRIGAILWAYGIGLLIGNIGILPEGGSETLNTMAEVSVPLALPLLLFSLDFKRWIKMAGQTFLSMILAFVSIISMIFLGYLLFGQHIDEGWKVSGMLTGVYTGGTPNMAAIKTALNVDNNTFILTHTYDMLISLLWFIFIITIGQKTLNLVLPATRQKFISLSSDKDVSMAEFDSYHGMLRRPLIFQLMVAFGISILIFALGYLIMNLVPENVKTVSIILTITSLGILASFVPKINQIKKSFQGGMYLIVVFSMAVASMADIEKLMNINANLFWYVGIAVWGSLFIHILLSMIFKVDTDTVIITSTALAFSPPFVPVVAGALKNKEIIISGLTVGIIGYALGNYLGVTIAYLLR